MATHQGESWQWRAEGFLTVPVKVIAPRQLRVYRVWGGTASEMGSPTRRGACFSFEAPRTRREAEKLFSVWEWGNNAAYITPFGVMQGITVFVGKAHPGDFHQYGVGAPGSQIFIEIAEIQRGVRKLNGAIPLVDDMKQNFIVSYKDPGRSWSS